MSSENFDIEQMRKAWVEMGKALGMKPVSDHNPDNLNKKKTALDCLRDRYHVFWIISLLMVGGGFLIFSGGIFVENQLNFWLGVAYAVYFLTVFGMDLWLWKGLATIDPLRMSVAEIADRSMFYRKRHLLFMAILLPMAIALIGFTGYVFSSEIYFLNGMVVGVVCGAIVGIMQFRKFMAEYRNLSE